MNGDRARAFLQRCGLDAIVAVSPANVGYLTGWWCWLDALARQWMFAPGASGERALPAFAVLVDPDDIALVVPAGLAANALELGSVDLHVYGAPPLAAVDL